MEKKTSKARGPHMPSEYDVADVSAIQALLIGDATAEQQKRALDWIIIKASGAYEFNYYPSDRDTSFALGRSFVGQQIIKLTKLNISKLRKESNVV